MTFALPTLTTAAAAALVAVLAANPAVAADGPGYGGNAGELSVTWTDPGLEGTVAAPVVPPDGGPSVDPERVGVVEGGPTLTIVGLGFRQLTTINVQVGEIADLERKSDVTGTVTVNVPAAESEETPTGASVLAVGLSPSGTTRTLVGSVPPKPSGLAPSSVVPWLAAAFAAGAAVYFVRRIRSNRAVPVEAADQPPDK